jgi:hypothetical protein
MRRREFIKLLGGAATTWPLAARAQQPTDRMRRIGVMVGYAEDDPEAQTRLAAFKQGLLTLGWSEGRNLKIDVRCPLLMLWTAPTLRHQKCHRVVA